MSACGYIPAFRETRVTPGERMLPASDGSEQSATGDVHGWTLVKRLFEYHPGFCSIAIVCVGAPGTAAAGWG